MIKILRKHLNLVKMEIIPLAIIVPNINISIYNRICIYIGKLDKVGINFIIKIGAISNIIKIINFTTDSCIDLCGHILIHL